MVDWVSHGLNAKDMGDFTLCEIGHIMRGAAHNAQVNAWMAGQYMLSAFHAPDDYPKCPELTPPQPSNPAVEAEMKAIRRRVILAHETKKAMKRHGS